jgi:hypothetical protein
MLTVGRLLLVSTTSSVEAVQAPLLMVQRSVALVPTGTPLTAEAAELALTIVAVPLTTDQLPVPTEGVLPNKVKLPLLQLDWSAPALAAVGSWLTAVVMLLLEAGLPVGQVALLVNSTVIASLLLSALLVSG